MLEDFASALCNISESSDDEDLYAPLACAGDGNGNGNGNEPVVLGDEWQIRYVMHNPAPDAKAHKLRAALGVAQLAFSETRAKHVNLTKCYNMLAGEKNLHKGGPGSHCKSTDPTSLEQSISTAAKKYCLLYHLWVPPLLFPICKAQPDIDSRDLSCWQTSDGQVVAEQAELWEMLPSELHKSLRTFPEFSRVFLKAMTEEHANIIKTIKDVSTDLFFSLDVKAALFLGDKALKAHDPKLFELLKKPGDSQYMQLSPILFVNPTQIRGNKLFKSPVLIKIAHVLMFGKAILSNKKHGGPKVQGSRMGVQTITEGLIAGTATMVRYLLSHDPEFTVKGEATTIPYQKDFEFYLKLLLHPEKRRWALDVIEFFNTGVFSMKSGPALQSADDSTGTSLHSCSWVDAVLSEIGNDVEPLTLPSHLPSDSEPTGTVSNSGPLSNTHVPVAVSMVVHGQEPTPRSPILRPGASKFLDLELDVDSDPLVPLLPVTSASTTAWPRPRLVKHCVNLNAAPDSKAIQVPGTISSSINLSVTPQVLVGVDLDLPLDSEIT